ncbi:MAG: DUF1150 family protein [Pseudomonadota bacterium]
MHIYKQLGLTSNIVYVKPVPTELLPKDMRAELNGEKEVFAVHGENGEQVALFTDRNLAFDLAKEYHFQAHSVH